MRLRMELIENPAGLRLEKAFGDEVQTILDFGFRSPCPSGRAVSANERAPGSLVSELLKALRRGADDDVALRLHLEHRKAALDKPVWRETKQPVNTVEPIRV